jgi:hypothetical protein
MVKNLRDRGRLGIRDPVIMNVSMGAKFLWRVINDTNRCGGKRYHGKNILEELD